MENGSEYRTLLKAFGIRFDVLVYGNVSPGTGQMGGAGKETQTSLGPSRASSRGVGGGKVLPLTSSESLREPHVWSLHCYGQGLGPPG